MKTLTSVINQAPCLLRDKVDVVGCVMLHVIGVDDAYTCQRKLKDLIDERVCSAQKFRLMLADLTYIHLNLKFFALNVLRTNTGTATVRKFASQFGVAEEDIPSLVSAMRDRQFRMVSVPFAKRIDRKAINEQSFEDAFVIFDKIYPDILRHIKHKTYSKLRFLSSASNVEFYDFHTDLMCKAIQTYVKMLPTDKSELHIANTLRATLNNHTVNLIKLNTTQKRARIVKGAADGFGGNKFEIITASENQLVRAFGVDDTVSYETLRNEEANTEEEKLRDSSLDYKMVMARFGRKYKEYLFIKLLSVQEHVRFTQYLVNNNLVAPHEDNVDFNSKVGDSKYFSVMCKFLGVCEKSAKRFADKIGANAYPELARLGGKPDAAI